MNEQLLKTSGANVLSSKKKLRKILREGGGGASAPRVLPRVEIKYEKNMGCEHKNGLKYILAF